MRSDPDVLVEAGGKIHQLRYDAGVLLAENLFEYGKKHADETSARAYVSAARRVERFLVGDESEPIVFVGHESVWVAHVLDHMAAGEFGSPDLIELTRALQAVNPPPSEP